MKLPTHGKKMKQKKKKRIKGDLGFDIVNNIIVVNHKERRKERDDWNQRLKPLVVHQGTTRKRTE